MVGSSEIIPKPQIEYLTGKGFIVVIPNYRLAPQVDGKTAFADCERALDWAVQKLPEMMQSKHNVKVDASRVVAYGHSSGGTIALHLASRQGVKAVTAFYPSLFIADHSTSSHQPTSAPPFGAMPDYSPTDEEWASITPEGVQISEAALASPGTIPPPRNRWQMHVLKHGQWMSVVQPDGDGEAIDPLTRITPHWAPVMIVQGELDNVPGSSLELARRAETQLKSAGVDVQLEVVQGAMHMFDIAPAVGTSDFGPKWEAVVKGLDWLVGHV
jgi:acetyl esterase/lipase